MTPLKSYTFRKNAKKNISKINCMNHFDNLAEFGWRCSFLCLLFVFETKTIWKRIKYMSAYQIDLYEIQMYLETKETTFFFVVRMYSSKYIWLVLAKYSVRYLNRRRRFGANSNGKNVQVHSRFSEFNLRKFDTRYSNCSRIRGWTDSCIHHVVSKRKTRRKC